MSRWAVGTVFTRTEEIFFLNHEMCLDKGCGSGLIYYGSGSTIFSQSGSSSGSGSKLKQNFRRQFLSEIFLKSKFESNQIKKYWCYSSNFFSKSTGTVVSAVLYLYSGKNFLKYNKCIFPLKFLDFLAPGSGFPIRIRIHKVTESGSTTLFLIPVLVRYRYAVENFLLILSRQASPPSANLPKLHAVLVKKKS
jgi:hypothetical protein